MGNTFYSYILSSLPLYFFFLVSIWERVKQTMLNTHACLQTFVLLKWFLRFSRWTFAIFVVTRRKYKINFILYCFRRDILYKISKKIDKGNLTYSCLFCDTQINTYTIYFWKWISGFAVQKNWKEYGRNFIKNGTTHKRFRFHDMSIWRGYMILCNL